MALGSSLSQRILDHYDAVPRGERRLADLLLAQPAAVLHHSAAELAARVGVSKATAARLFRRLGYPSFRAARFEARGAAPVDTAGAPGLDLGAHLEADVQNLVKTIEHQRSDALTRALRALAHGEKLWVVGFGDDYPLAHVARAFLIRVRPDIRMLPIGGFSVPEEFASISAADTMLAFGCGRRTRALTNVVRSAQDAGARIVFVTDLSGTLAGEATILRCRTRGLGAFDSFAAPVSLVSWLCTALAARIGEPAVERLRRIDDIHAAWGELLAQG